MTPWLRDCVPQMGLYSTQISYAWLQLAILEMNPQEAGLDYGSLFSQGTRASDTETDLKERSCTNDSLPGSVCSGR